jgi:hypothetical protein
MITMSLLALHDDQRTSMSPMRTSTRALRCTLLSQWRLVRYVTFQGIRAGGSEFLSSLK